MSQDQRRLVRATIVNTIGTVADAGRVVLPMVFIALFASPAYGVFVAALGWTELLRRIVVTGFSDSVQYVAAREEGRAHARGDASPDSTLPLVAGTGLALSLGAAILLALAVAAAAETVYRTLYQQTQPTSLVTAVRLLAWVLPLHALAAIPLAALKSRLMMGADVAVNALVQPVIAIALAWGLRTRLDGPVAMAAGQLAAVAASGLFAWVAFARRFPVGPVLAVAVRSVLPGRGARERAVLRDLVGFAVPQGTGALAAVALERGDALVLAAFVSPAVVALYAVASDLARLLRTVKANFSSVLSPVVARLAAQDGPRAVQEAVDRVAGWIATAAVPALFFLLAFRHELFSLYRQAAPPAFFPVLLLGPLASCVFGLSGNVLLMTGFARLNLAVGVAAMASGLALALALVPRFGPAGAAWAAALSQVGLVVTLTREARRRLGIRVGFAPLRAALADAVLLGLAAAILHFLPRAVAAGAWQLDVLALRLAVGAAAIGGYLLLRRRRTAAALAPPQ